MPTQQQPSATSATTSRQAVAVAPPTSAPALQQPHDPPAVESPGRRQARKTVPIRLLAVNKPEELSTAELDMRGGLDSRPKIVGEEVFSDVENEEGRAPSPLLQPTTLPVSRKRPAAYRQWRNQDATETSAVEPVSDSDMVEEEVITLSGPDMVTTKPVRRRPPKAIKLNATDVASLAGTPKATKRSKNNKNKKLVAHSARLEMHKTSLEALPLVAPELAAAVTQPDLVAVLEAVATAPSDCSLHHEQSIVLLLKYVVTDHVGLLALFSLVRRLPLPRQHLFVSRLLTTQDLALLSPTIIYDLLAAADEPNLPGVFVEVHPSYRLWFAIAALGAGQHQNEELGLQLLNLLDAPDVLRLLTPCQLAFVVDCLGSRWDTHDSSSTGAAVHTFLSCVIAVMGTSATFSHFDQLVFYVALWRRDAMSRVVHGSIISQTLRASLPMVINELQGAFEQLTAVIRQPLALPAYLHAFPRSLRQVKAFFTDLKEQQSIPHGRTVHAADEHGAKFFAAEFSILNPFVQATATGPG